MKSLSAIWLTVTLVFFLCSTVQSQNESVDVAESANISVTPVPLNQTRAFLNSLKQGSTETDNEDHSKPVSNVCANAVQGRVAWNYTGNKKWAPVNVAKLCGTANDSQEPAKCFNRVVHGNVNWGAGNKWDWKPAVELCSGTRNHKTTVSCFIREIKSGRKRDDAISRCSKSANTTVGPLLIAPQIMLPPLQLKMDLPISRAVGVAPPAPAQPAQPAVNIDKQISANLQRAALTSDISAKLPKVTTAKVTAAQRTKIDDFVFKEAITLQAANSTGATNLPVNQPFELLSGTSAEVSLTPADISNISNTVYQDANENSGVFYYLPRAYNIAWDENVGPEHGLGLRISYEQSPDSENPNTVRMAVLLDSRVDFQEVQLASQLLSARSKQSGQNFIFRELRPFPLAAPPAVSLADDLSRRFNLNPDQIAINALSDALDQIEISWITDPITAGNIRLTLREGFGLNGVAQFRSPNEKNGPIPMVPINIRIDKAETFGRILYHRNRNMQNKTPFDLKILHLHALTIKQGRAAILSWELNNKIIPANAVFDFNTRHLPEILDAQVQLYWIGYRVDKSCEQCVRETIDHTVIGNLWPDTTSIVLKSLTPLAESGAAMLEIATRSRFLQPDSRDLVDGPVLIFDADGQTHTIDRIFKENQGQDTGSGDDWPLLEYSVSAIMPSGETIRGQNWIDVRSERVFIGSHQLRVSTGAFAEQ